MKYEWNFDTALKNNCSRGTRVKYDSHMDRGLKYDCIRDKELNGTAAGIQVTALGIKS